MNASIAICEPECPNDAISLGAEIYEIDPASAPSASVTSTPQCREVCPVDCIPVNPAHVETREQLQLKYAPDETQESTDRMTMKASPSSRRRQEIAAGAEAEAVKNNWAVTIAVVDDGGHLLWLQRLDGAAPVSSWIGPQKAVAPPPSVVARAQSTKKW